MKNTFTLFTTLMLVIGYSNIHAQISNYCLSSPSSTSFIDTKIDNVTLNTINNSSAGPTCVGYTDFTSISTSLNPGASYTISVTNGTCNTNGTHYTNYKRAWIDYNGNNVFDDPAERIMDAPGTSGINQVHTANFTVPNNAVPGTTYMRVVDSESGPQPPCSSAATNYTWGETEDYTIIIAPNLPNDAGVSAIISPESDCDGSNQNVVVEVKNYGINQINVVNVHWTVNSVSQTPVALTTLLDTINGSGSNTANVTLGSLTLVGGNSYDIEAWTENPNNQTDANDYNDTSYSTVLGYNYPVVNLGLDTTTCPNDLITLDAGGGRDSVIWNTGAKTQSILANNAQTYMVEVWKNECLGGDTISVSFFPAPPTVFLGNDTMICYGDSIILDATTPGVSYLWHDGSPLPTYVADTTGSYSVIIEDVNTCKNSDNINVSLFVEPVISMSVVPRNSICFGSPYEFRAASFTQGSTMYQWKINTANAGAPTSNNKFQPTLTYGDSVNVELITNVCSATPYSIPSNYIVMYINPEPKLISGSAATDTVLENTSKNYLVPIVQGSTFTWSALGGTITSPIGNAVTVDWSSATPSAKVMVTEKDNGNCSYTNERSVVIISIVGIKDEDNQIGIGNAYPNPANNSVTIPLISDGNWNIDLSLYDMTGKRVKAIYNGEISGNRDFTFNVDNLNNGMYFYKVSTEDGYESVKKISIQH